MSDTPRTDTVERIGDCMTLYKTWVSADFARTLERELAEAREENTELRTLLACRIAGPRLYHDDGELQDTSAYPFIDWRRDAVETIQVKLIQRAATREQGGEVGDE